MQSQVNTKTHCQNVQRGSAHPVCNRVGVQLLGPVEKQSRMVPPTGCGSRARACAGAAAGPLGPASEVMSHCCASGAATFSSRRQMGALCSEHCAGLPCMIEPAGARARLDTRVVWWPAPWCACWASPGSWLVRRRACHSCVSVGRCTLELAQPPLESCTGMARCRGRLTLGGGDKW